VSRSYFTRVVRLSYLAPHITQAILDGRQPRDLTADKLLAHSRLPLGWHEQRTVLGGERLCAAGKVSSASSSQHPSFPA
jgi:site-specific DNA recombinase